MQNDKTIKIKFEQSCPKLNVKTFNMRDEINKLLSEVGDTGEETQQLKRDRTSRFTQDGVIQYLNNLHPINKYYYVAGEVVELPAKEAQYYLTKPIIGSDGKPKTYNKYQDQVYWDFNSKDS